MAFQQELHLQNQQLLSQFVMEKQHLERQVLDLQSMVQQFQQQQQSIRYY
jgi:hypothetical protein